jgi:hypothetical protein
MAICKGTVLARFFLSATFFRQTGFSLARFSNFSPWQVVVFAKLFAVAPLICEIRICVLFLAF